MDDTDQDQKTEEPTGKRLSEARDQGNLPVSREMSSWFLVVSIFIVITWFASGLAHGLYGALRVFIEKPEQISIQDGGLQNALMGVLSSSVFSLIVTFGLLFVMAILGTMIQTGFYCGTGKMQFDLSKLSPFKGFGQLFSKNAIADLVKSFFKLIVLGYLTYRVLAPLVDDLPHLPELGLQDELLYLQDNASHLLIILLLLITVIAVADSLYTRYEFFKNLRMTKDEVKDEHKQTEGDPMVKGRLRQIRVEKARRRMMAQVPNASVVITNPTHYAVALEYDGKKMRAPVVVAKGIDRIALRIREVAEEHNVPIVSNPPLARLLNDTVELDSPIMPEQYRAVAEVISYVHKLKNKGKNK